MLVVGFLSSLTPTRREAQNEQVRKAFFAGSPSDPKLKWHPLEFRLGVQYQGRQLIPMSGKLNNLQVFSEKSNTPKAPSKGPTRSP